ncbi:MAG TPA: DUF1080 domain-containing protein [Chitinophagaceae bacterium]
MHSKIILGAVFLSCFLKGVAQDSDGWISLFNGKDLTGFRQLNGKAIYEAKNGEIVGTTVSNEPNSFLATTETYGNFILELELFVDPSMNSGIQFRSQSIASYKDGRVHGYQMEIDPSDRSWSGAIFDEGRRGWLYTLDLNPAAKTAFKNNQWNKYRIECIGSTIRTWVNGIATAHLIDDLTPEGFIALQVHAVKKNEAAGKQIRWRNIRIKTQKLKPSPYDNIFVANLIPNNLSVQEQQNGFTMLWDGKTTNGWQGITKNTFPADRWKIKDGELMTIKADNTGLVKGKDIVTTQEFGAFELKFDFKLSAGASSGVQYFVAASKGKNGQVPGLEYQIVDDDKHADAKAGKNGNHTLGSLYDLIAPVISDERFIRKAGEWNEGIVKVQPDNKVAYWLNGIKVLEFIKGSQEYLNLVRQSQFSKVENFGKVSKGKILLQDGGDNVAFRSIKIRKLN